MSNNLPPKKPSEPNGGKNAAAKPAAPAKADPLPGTKGGSSTREGSQAKANVVPNPNLAERPKSVAPTVVQAAPGATTRFVTRPATPPEHQQSGMPKITATPEFINRSTLLPKRGPQAAAVSPVPPPPRTTPAQAKQPADPKPAR